jgi:Flp pilus assembly protein TadG
MKFPNTFWWLGDTAVRQSARFLRAMFRPERSFLLWPDRSKNPVQGESGQAMIEVAVVLPVMLTLVIGLMEVCMAFYTHEYISELAREGTRYAVVHGSTCETSAGASCTASTTNSDSSSVYSYVKGLGWPNIGGGTLTPVVTYPDGDEAPNHRVKVSITYQFPYRIPFIPASTLSMTSSSTMYIIQ